MSHIFDALHQPNREDAKKTATERPDDSTPVQHCQPLFKTPDDFRGLGTVRCHVRPEDRVVGCCQNHNLGAEKFRSLHHRLSQLRRRRPLSKLLVTSFVPKEGKTVVAINLALTLARGSSRVALVDADLRQPEVHHTLGLESLPGLAEVLEGKLECAACLRRVDPLGLYYLPAGHASINPFELLQGPRMRALMELIAPAFDWIIFDSPPLIPFADAHYLAVLSDAVLLVVRPGVTPRKTVRQALAALDGACVAGVVMNASDDISQDKYYYLYQKDSYHDSAEDEALPPVPSP